MYDTRHQNLQICMHHHKQIACISQYVTNQQPNLAAVAHVCTSFPVHQHIHGAQQHVASLDVMQHDAMAYTCTTAACNMAT